MKLLREKVVQTPTRSIYYFVTAHPGSAPIYMSVESYTRVQAVGEIFKYAKMSGRLLDQFYLLDNYRQSYPITDRCTSIFMEKGFDTTECRFFPYAPLSIGAFIQPVEEAQRAETQLVYVVEETLELSDEEDEIIFKMLNKFVER